jgi:hypothetical protein
MEFVAGHNGSLDRTGGLPTHLPSAFPHCRCCQAMMAFLAQFYCASGRLYLPGTLCIQLYQCRGVGMGGEPVPIAMRVPVDAEPNTQGAGVIQPGVGLYDIRWVPGIDPDIVPCGPDPTDEELRLAASKVGGTPYCDWAGRPGSTFLFQLDEEPAGFNFAGRMVVVTLGTDQELHVSLALQRGSEQWTDCKSRQ